LLPSNLKTVVITTPGEIAAFSSLLPFDLLNLRSPAALSTTVSSLTAKSESITLPRSKKRNGTNQYNGS
jgi:hypothetical protein